MHGFPFRYALIAMTLFWAAGCATNLQKAQQRLREGKTLQARTYFQAEYAAQRKRAAEPCWHGRRYEYRFSKENTVEALLGMAETYRLTDERDNTALHVGMLNDYCLRHAIELPSSRLQPLESYLREGKNDSK